MKEMKKIANNIFKVALSLFLGGAILYWMYRGFDFKQVEDVLLHKMNWTWMLLSFPFGILAQVFRGWRWKQTLEPLGEKPRDSVSVSSIFLSYALSLVIPRIGEFARCGVLRRWDGISFPKSLGTVVTERAIDSLLVLIIAEIVFLLQIPVFLNFFRTTGTSMDSILGQFTATGYLVTAICGVAVLILLHFLLRKLAIYNKVKATLGGLWQGVISLKGVKNVPLFSALLSHVPVLRVDLAPESDVRIGNFHRGQHRRHRPYPQRSRTLAFRREDDAYPLRHPVERRTLFRAHRALGADLAGHPPRHLRLDSTGFHQETFAN